MNLTGTDHAITPQKDSAYTLTGLPANLLYPWDYPVEAVCRECGKPIRRESYSSPDWAHFTR